MITIALYLGVILGLGVLFAVVIKALKNVKAKAKVEGVDFSDGIQQPELVILARLLREQANEALESEAIANILQAISKLEKKPKV